MIKFLAYQFNAFIRLLPNALTDPFPPSLMGKPFLEKAKQNPFEIKVNRTNQAVCAKHCGNCPSNPFTHGGLYCLSGKSKKEVDENGCNCFDCELFEQCGGGKGYFCKFGSASEMNQIGTDQFSSKDPSLSNSFENSYDSSFIHSLLKNQEFKKPKSPETPASTNKQNTKTVKVTYEQENITIDADPSLTLLENSLNNKINHTHACGGRAKCSTCRVLVISDAISFNPRNEEEQKISNRKLFTTNIRLACQIKPQTDSTIRRLVIDEKQIEEAVGEGSLFSSSLSLDKDVTVLFCDLRSFTNFSENSLPYDIVYILNEYFQTICEPIDKYNGYVDKYMGDGLMAVFGITQSQKSHQYNAMSAAFEMLQALKAFNLDLQKKNNHQFKMGIGIHSGEVVLATVGFKKKRQFTAIGDVVNTASRIEGATKEFNTPILVSDTIYQQLKSDLFWGKQLKTELKGKSDFLKLYEPLSFKVK